MKKTYLATCVLLAALTLGACKKSSSNKSKTELLTQQSWIVSNVEWKTSSASSYSVFPAFTSTPACEKDDALVLRSNMTYERNEGATKCSSSDPQIYETGTWAFQDSETKIVVDGDVAIIEQLDDNTFAYSQTDVYGGTTYTFKITMRH